MKKGSGSREWEMGSEKLFHDSPLPIPHPLLPTFIRNPQSAIRNPKIFTFS